jgi:phage shock protein A
MPEQPSGSDPAAADTPPPQPSPSVPIAAPDIDTGYTAGGVPTFESVREKIETRYGTALGSAELDAETPEGRSIEEQYEAREKAAAERLAEIHASMHPPQQDNT